MDQNFSKGYFDINLLLQRGTLERILKRYVISIMSIFGDYNNGRN